MNAIEVRCLSKTFVNGRKALDNLELAVGAGEMVALIGASGSGKSTLIRHLSGLVTADKSSGSRVMVKGALIQEDGRLAADVRAARREIGVVFQQFNLVGRLSVLTNVLAGRLGRTACWRGTLGRFSTAEQHQAMSALARMGIAETARRRASMLSGGQQQRAAIARTLVQEASIILADEPIASLDPSSARRVMEALKRINDEDGITVVVSLHQVEYARYFCRRTVAIENGRIVFDGPSRALSDERLRQIYGAASDELILPREEPAAGSEPPPITPAYAFS